MIFCYSDDDYEEEEDDGEEEDMKHNIFNGDDD